MVRWVFSFSLILWIPEIRSSSFWDYKEDNNKNIIDNSKNDQVILLTKLSQNDLLNILKSPKTDNFREYNEKDSRYNEYQKNHVPTIKKIYNPNTKDDNSAFTMKQNLPEFRLEKKSIPFNFKSNLKLKVFNKLNKMLNKRPNQSNFDHLNETNNDNNKIIFDFLLSQLNNLCCNKYTKSIKLSNKNKMFDNDKETKSNSVKEKTFNERNKFYDNSEHVFLVVNDDIDNYKAKEPELKSVDPNSLNLNSTIIPLALLPKYIEEEDIKILVKEISRELSKSKYLSMLMKISDGQLLQNNSILKLLNTPQSRRYIKPHRCNYQAPLSKIHSGPRWIICTGYLNLNTPSLYD